MKWICFKKLKCITSGENKKSMPCHITKKAEIDILLLLRIDYFNNSDTIDPTTHVMFSWDVIVNI